MAAASSSTRQGMTSPASARDLAMDADLIGEDDGATASQGFDERDAEIFGVRREDEDVGGAEGGPLGFTGEEAGPHDIGSDAQAIGVGLEAGHQFGIARSGEDQKCARERGAHPREGGKEEFERLFCGRSGRGRGSLCGLAEGRGSGKSHGWGVRRHWE